MTDIKKALVTFGAIALLAACQTATEEVPEEGSPPAAGGVMMVPAPGAEGQGVEEMVVEGGEAEDRIESTPGATVEVDLSNAAMEKDPMEIAPETPNH